MQCLPTLFEGKVGLTAWVLVKIDGDTFVVLSEGTTKQVVKVMVGTDGNRRRGERRPVEPEVGRRDFCPQEVVATTAGGICSWK